MAEDWQFQLRVYLNDTLSELARSNTADPALRPLTAVLEKHGATLVNQFGAFEAYVAEAERNGPESYPLYKWTKATAADPAQRAKHGRTFSIHVNGQEVYGREAADPLEAELRPLAGGPVVERMTRHDTNPANNLQVPAEYR